MKATLLRLPRPICLVGLVACLVGPPAEGQGIFRRLEERLREQIREGLSTPEAAPAAAPEAGSQAAAPARPRPRLGVEVEVIPDATGQATLQVTSVEPASPAAEAGLQPGDQILSLAGTEVRSIPELAAVLERSRPGDGLLMLVQRQGQQRFLTVTMQEALPPASPPSPATRAPAASGRASGSGSAAGQPPAVESDRDPAGATTALPPPDAGRLGLVVEDPRPRQPGASRLRSRSRGALVVEVDPATPAAEAGLQIGDLIVALDGRLIPDARTLIAQMRQTRPGQQIDLQFLRDERLRRVQVTLGGEATTAANRPPAAAARGPADPQARQEAASPAAGQGKGDSVLGNLGSVLGGFLGGKSASSGAGAGTAPAAGSNAAGTNAAADPSAPSGRPLEQPPASDEMPAPAGGAEQPQPTAPDLPPSLATPAETESGQTATTLRQTIRRLEQTNRRLEDRLRQLENQVQQLLRQSAAEGG